MDELNSETFESNFLKHALSKILTKEELVEYCLECDFKHQLHLGGHRPWQSMGILRLHHDHS